MNFILSIIAGAISALGLGGGTILIAFLTNFQHMDQKLAQSTNLFFFIPTAVIATIVNIKNKRIDFKIAVAISVFGIIGAIVGANLSTNIDTIVLRKLFSIFLIGIAIFEFKEWIKKYVKKV